MKKEAQSPEAKEHEERWKFTQQAPEAQKEPWRWVSESPKSYEQRGRSWQPEIREQASRRFFQVWNALKGRGVDSNIRPNEPLRCSVWRYRILNFDKILEDLISKKETGLIDIYTKAMDAIYPELQERAKADPAIADRMEAVDALIGKGRYEHEPLAEKIKFRQDQVQTKVPEYMRNISSSEDAVRMFFRELGQFPGLQEKFLNMVVDDAYTNFEKQVSNAVVRTGFYAGSSSVGGQMRPNKLLTFFLMQDPYPYLESVPVKADGERYKNIQEIEADFPGGNTPENPIPSTPLAGGKKTKQEAFTIKAPSGTFYVKNAQNPKYDFTSFDSTKTRDQDAVRTSVRKMVQDLQKQSMFGQVFLAKNVLKESPGFEDKKAIPGISLIDLGHESPYMDVVDKERDLTQFEDGGLFWIPEKGVPGQLKKKEPPSPPGAFKLKSFVAPRMVTVAQVAGDVWVDEKGNAFDTMDELMQAQTVQDWEAYKPQMKESLKGLIGADLSKPTKMPAPVPARAPAPVVTPEFKPIDEEEKVPEEEMALAAKKIVRLVRIANDLDSKGLKHEADVIDGIVKELIEEMSDTN